MSQLAFKKDTEADFAESIINNRDLCSVLEQAVFDAHGKVFFAGHPPYKSYPAGTYWNHVTQQAHGRLRAAGFTLDIKKNQLRLLSSAYQWPVRLRFAKGEVSKGVAILAADKGEMTKEGVIQNQQHFQQQLALSPDLVSTNRSVAPELNMWVIYKLQPTFITAWFARLMDRKSSKKYECVSAIICTRSLGNDNITLPVSLPPISDGGYDMPLEDKATGT